MIGSNTNYERPDELPSILPVFPLRGCLLLPRGDLPLNIFEPRYVEMVDHILSTHRLVGMIQPEMKLNDEEIEDSPSLCKIGCLGKLTAFQETEDGGYVITLTGIARFHLTEEVQSEHGFRLCKVETKDFGDDFLPDHGEDNVDRKSLITTFRAYLDANGLDADWESVNKATNEILVNALSMMSPFGPAEKQALLEAESLKIRADTLVALTEIELARNSSVATPQYQ